MIVARKGTEDMVIWSWVDGETAPSTDMSEGRLSKISGTVHHVSWVSITCDKCKLTTFISGNFLHFAPPSAFWGKDLYSHSLTDKTTLLPHHGSREAGAQLQWHR